MWHADTALKHLSQFYITPFIILGGISIEVLISAYKSPASLQLMFWIWLQHHLAAKKMKWEKAELTAGWDSRDTVMWPYADESPLRGGLNQESCDYFFPPPVKAGR